MNDPKRHNLTGSLDNDLISLLKDGNSPVRRLFDSIQLGIIFLDPRTNLSIYSNRFIKTLPQKHQQAILSGIRHQLITQWKNQQDTMVNLEIKPTDKDDKYIYTYSIYAIDRQIAVVFLEETSSKSIMMQAQQENRLYDKFSELIAEIAHEIANPLAGISTLLQLLLLNAGVWPVEKILNYIERAVNEIDRLNVFLDRIRDVSSEDDLNLRIVSLFEQIDRLYSENCDRIKESKIEFHVDVAKDIKVMVDEQVFYQILLNLLNNSLHILKPKDTIRIYVEHIDNYFITLVYRNSGKGIPVPNLERIFSPFFTTRSKGHGIGLALSLKLMIRMGGTIKAVQPEDKIGAKFVIFIPNKVKR